MRHSAIALKLETVPIQGNTTGAGLTLRLRKTALVMAVAGGAATKAGLTPNRDSRTRTRRTARASTAALLRRRTERATRTATGTLSASHRRS